MIYLSNINLHQNELQNAVIQPLAVAPSNPKLGQIYCDSTDSRIKFYNGTEWQVVGVVVESSATNGTIKVDGVEMKVYELPTASADTLGGIKVGAGLTIDENGVLSTDMASDFAKKADKVAGAVEGNFAGLDANGNLTDSGKKAADFETAGAAKAVQGETTATVKSVEDSVSALTETVGKKVDAVEGKGLSTNDYTTEEKTKLAGIATGAEVNVQADWNVEDTLSDAYIANKPTKLSDFENDGKFIDNTVADLVNYYTKTESYTKTEVDGLIGKIATIQIVVPEDGTLPETGKSNELYLVPKEGGANPNAYDEYLWTGSAFEKIGDTEIDLSSYLTKTGDASKNTVAFTPAEERVLPATGDTLEVIAGKVAKYLTDLNAVAFSGSYNDLKDTPNHVKYDNVSMTEADGTQKVHTITGGSQILSVTMTDAVTHEVVGADVTINGLTVTVKLAAAYANGLDIVVAYL